MNVSEYALRDGLGLAELVAKKDVSPQELALTAVRAIEAVNPSLGAVVEIYPDRTTELDERTLGSGPFRGVPFLIKDVFGHEKGRKIEFASRLCKGMRAEADTYLAELFRASGLNIIGRSATPEYSMAATTESLFYGNTSNPWRAGYSAGGSSGGSQAAVTAGLVPLAHGSDLGGSIRIPASLCGGVGLKPSRGRISFGPMLDEGAFGMSMNFVQAKTVRDVAAMLDCLALRQTGDPFVIPKPAEPYTALMRHKAPKLKVGIVLDRLLGVDVDPEVASAVEATGKVLADMGHVVEPATADFGGRMALKALIDVWYFAFDARLESYAERTGLPLGPETLEPVTLNLYEYAKTITPERLVTALAALNGVRRQLGAFYRRHDIWLSPTTARVAEPWGRYNLARTGIGPDNLLDEVVSVPCQFTLPHNIMGTPAISLPLAMHSSGLPIGVQLASSPAQEQVLIQLAAALEEAMPWYARVPPLHASKAGTTGAAPRQSD
jgi:amidase